MSIAINQTVYVVVWDRPDNHPSEPLMPAVKQGVVKGYLADGPRWAVLLDGAEVEDWFSESNVHATQQAALSAGLSDATARFHARLNELSQMQAEAESLYSLWEASLNNSVSTEE